MGAPDTVFVDYARSAGVASMVLGGMTVAERVLREAARAGATRAIVRGDALPPLPRLPLEVERIPAAAEPPAGAVAIDGTVIAGVQISDAATRRRAARALLQTCRRPHDGIGDRYVIRAISLRITSVLCRLGARPNQVTYANIAVGLAACAAAARGAFAAAGALILLQVVLDSSDGELARLRHLHSRFGMLLDNASDDLIDNLFIATLGVGLGGIWAPIGIAAAAARGAQSAMIHIVVARRGQPGDVLAFRWWFDREDDALAERFEVKLTPGQVLRSIGRRDLYVLLWSAGCLAGVPIAALGLGVILAAAQLGLTLIHVTVTLRAGRAR